LVAVLVSAPSALAVAPSTYTVSGFADGAPGVCSPPVGSTDSCTTLRAAVQAADTGGGAPTIMLGAGRYVLGGAGGTNAEIDLDTPMTIAGAGAGKTVIAQTDGTTNVVTANAPEVTIEDVEITGGAEGGVSNGGTLTLIGDLIDLNTHTGQTGAPGDDGDVASGGGIYNGSVLTVEQSTITQNKVTGGAGGPTTGSVNAGSGGQANGGGIDSNGSLTVTDSTISDNMARAGAGGTAVNGHAGGGDNSFGGGLEVEGNTLLERDTVSDNHVIGGAGANVTGSGMAGRGDSGTGGGIDFGGFTGTTTFVVVNTTITGNSALDGTNGSTPGGSSPEPTGGDGGGINFSEKGAVTLGNVTLVGNTAAPGGSGGNLYTDVFNPNAVWRRRPIGSWRRAQQASRRRSPTTGGSRIRSRCWQRAPRSAPVGHARTLATVALR
jgi:hypothetical protein